MIEQKRCTGVMEARTDKVVCSLWKRSKQCVAVAVEKSVSEDPGEAHDSRGVRSDVAELGIEI